MTLAQTIAEARVRTRNLREALLAGDLVAAGDLLAERAAAMAAFKEAHEAAGASITTACRPDMVALQLEDRALQELAAEALARADQDCRHDLGANPAGQSAYRDEPALACVDRRA